LCCHWLCTLLSPSFSSMLGLIQTMALSTKQGTSGVHEVPAEQAFGVKDEGYETSMKAPLVANTDSVMRASASKLYVRTVKEKITMARSAVKFGVGMVKHKFDIAATGAAGKLAFAGCALKVGVDTMKGKCDAGVGAVRDKFTSAVLLSKAEADFVEMLVPMGFSRRDAADAVRRLGTEDFNAVMDFLCTDPLLRSALEWDSYIDQFIARRMIEMEFEEEESFQIALALSQFEAEVRQAHQQDCPQDSGKVFHLQPSVGTWMLPLPKARRSPSPPLHANSTDSCEETPASATSTSEDELA